MSELDGIGAAVTGGLVARAVEPDSGAIAGPGPGGNCLNCGTPLTGPYCNRCGQKAVLHRSLRTYFGEFAAGLFNFEGKFWRTLPMLAWHPGELTRRYVEGQRARFISPIALYLFSVFLMFAALNFNGTLDANINDTMKDNVRQALVEQEKRIEELTAERAQAVAAKKPVAAIDARIATEREDLDTLRKIDTGAVQVNDKDLDEAPPWVRDLVHNVQRDPDRLVFNIQDAASKYSWLLIPISVPFLWLLFPLRRRHHLFDHAVFVTYSLSFMMMLVIVASLLVWANMPGLASLLFFVPPIHMYRQLKGAYQLGRLSALVRTTALVIFAFVASTFFAVTIVGLGLLG